MTYRIKGKFVSKGDYDAWQSNKIPNQSSKRVKGKHHFVYLIDESSSMIYHEKGVIPALKSFTNQHIIGEPLTKDVVISIFTFCGEMAYKSLNQPIRERKVSIGDTTIQSEIEKINYYPKASTPLYWAIIESLKSITLSPDDTLALYIITDGEENVSQISEKVIRDSITIHINDGRYSFIVSCPTQSSKNRLKTLGIPENNILVWEQTQKGFQEMTYANTYSTRNTRSLYKSGETQTFNAFVDMQNVTPTQIQKELQDVTKQYKVLQVEKECDIKDFFEEKTNLPYSPGIAYYQLTKKELIQSNKDVLIYNKLSGKLYGGAEARALIGLSNNTNTKVTPLNFMTYEIYVQSNSVNRKLVRGTKLYYGF